MGSLSIGTHRGGPTIAYSQTAKLLECLMWETASYSILGSFTDADVAQSVEQRIRNAWVSGSNPLIGSINSMIYGRMDARQIA
jgi:hypothetical protein